MGQSTSFSAAPEASVTFTACASLAALGCQLQHLQLFEPIRSQVQIAQKTVLHSPIDKLFDAFITILAGAHGLVEVNTRLRCDVALQQAFGRTSCGDQSTIQDTLNACTEQNVQELTTALTRIYRTHSQGYRHDYHSQRQVLDVDLSGMPCGKKAALATKGYFPNQRNRRGRQLGRVLASRYGEVVSDQLFAGSKGLVKALQPMVEAAEQVLELDADKRARTIVRLDSGGGSIDDINWLLERGYQVQTKDYSRARARKLGKSVTEWFDDPQIVGRQVGWVETPTNEYVRELRRIAVRWQKKNGTWEYALVLSSLTAPEVLAETGEEQAQLLSKEAVTLAYVRFYDARGGGCETSFKDDKQGLGMTKRSKKRFEAQQMLTLLGTLAHNVMIWAREWLAVEEPRLHQYGIKRLVRDVLHISGFLVRDIQGRVVAIVLNHLAPLVHGLTRSLALLLRPACVVVSWGQI
jgi:hypothetical protein